MEVEQEIIEAFFERMSSPAYIKDENLKFVYVNSAYAEFYGMEPERFIGRTSSQISNTIATRLLEQDEAKVLASGAATQIGDRATSNRGTTIWREVERKPIITQNGTRYLTVILRDVSKYKDIEFQLEDTRNELEKVRELANIAEHRSADFLAKICHQVGSPTRSIISVVNSVSDGDFDKDRGSSIEQILSLSNTILGVVDDLSNYTSLDIMQAPVRSESFELFKLVCEVTSAVMPEASKKNLQFLSYIDPDIPMNLLGDAGKIRQVITNLISNAIRFTESGEVKLNISAVPHNNDQTTTVRFEIHDTGRGITAKEQEHLFDKYRPTKAGLHVGQGVSVSSALIALMGGIIRLDSAAGIGSKFWFELDFDVPKKIPQSIQKIPNLEKKRFIVIDDSEFDKALLEHQLKEWGGDVAACRNAEEAIAVMCALFEKGFTVEGVFIDDETNQSNNIDLYALIKDDEVLSHIPLFMMVSSADNFPTGEGVERNNYILKPLEIGSLRSLLLGIFSEHYDVQGTHEDINDLPRSVVKDPKIQQDRGLDKLIRNHDKGTNIDILLLESNTVNQIMLAQILESIGYQYKITSDIAEGEALFKSHQPKLVIIDAASREFNNEDTRLCLEKLKRFNGLVPLLGMMPFSDSADGEDETNLLLPVLDGQIKKPLSPPELFNKIEKWMQIADASQIRRA
ncbi:ATP-binding protein [Lentilitoribacter sp. Alg239-R112]|uniref:ATP-binding protein n=1 Tax=Lentilitoribacter sp. Alg239-R112 TaxID=2305987 RepID=UPI0013A6E5F2|nr:ATP-binding protein [Lentilitoribacter sp. Alg239-R112]